MQGASPLASPRLNPRGTGSTCQSGTRRVRLRNRQLGAKAIEPPFYWQCRQPRRGGTGGEELRRLRWSSPPGQGEQVPQGEQLPAWHLLGRFCKCRRRSNAGDARGEAPCIRKQKISPFPAGEGGRGDRGQERKLKAGAAGDKEGKPPFRHHSGRVSGRPKSPSPPQGTTAAGRAGARAGHAPRRAPHQQG